MAKKISQLTQATEVKSDDVTVIVQDGETKKLPLNMMVTKQDIENKRIAGLAKLDEIEATYENDTYTPTITVKNKSSVKTGEGDEVDYSANVMDGHVKSAILKGNKLVNLINYKGNFDGREIISDNTFNIDATKPFQELIIGKEYTFITYVSQTQVGNISIVSIEFNEKDTGTKKALCVISNPINGVNKVKFTVPSNYGSYLRSYIKTSSIGGSVTVKGMIIEGDLTQEDIPYFTGMQSVKMPVLTTTGKNLFDFEKTQSGYLGDNPYALYAPDQSNRTSDYIRVKPNTTYTYSFNGFTASQVGSEYWTGWYYYTSPTEVSKKNMKRQVSRGSADTFKTVTFTTPSDCYYVRIGSRGLALDGATVQLEEGSTATEYEPYKTNILTVNEEVTLRGIGDVKDTLDFLTGEVTERIGDVVIDGTQNGVYDYVTNEQLGLLTLRLPKILDIKNYGINLYGLL